MGIYSKYVFPRLMNFAMSGENFDEVRRTTLAGVRGHTLEIGFGTGLKLPHYPDSLNQLTTIDINPGMGRLAERRVQESQIEVQHRILSGESLPMDDATFEQRRQHLDSLQYSRREEGAGRNSWSVEIEGRFVVVEHGLGDESRSKDGNVASHRFKKSLPTAATWTATLKESSLLRDSVSLRSRSFT